MHNRNDSRKPFNVHVAIGDADRIRQVVVRPPLPQTLMIIMVWIWLLSLIVIKCINAETRHLALNATVAAVLLPFVVARCVNRTTFSVHGNTLSVTYGPCTLFRIDRSFLINEIAQISIEKTYSKEGRSDMLVSR